MYKIDFQNPIAIYFIGIGGISMSGLAEVLLEEKFQVKGSDRTASPLTQKLEQNGATIYYGQETSHIDDTIDLVVYTAAIHSDNPEFIDAKKRGLPMLSRAELLGQIMRNYKTPIAVSGTHGKTTGTSMLSHILMAAKMDPTISVGGILPSIHGNIRVGQSDYFITEACEYTNSFLHFFPRIGIILNIDADHLDFFKDLDQIRQSFHQFAKLLPKDGALIINSEIQDYEEITKDILCPVITFGIHKPAHYQATDLSYNQDGSLTFTLVIRGVKSGRCQLGVAGKHNVLNALSAIAAADFLGIPLALIKEGLSSFHGTDRRFQRKGVKNGVIVVDDYAHHPTEIAATLHAAKHYPHKDLWVVFQPHTYSRTKLLFESFVESLCPSPHLILTDIYAARETDTLGVSSAQLCQVLQEKGCDAHYISDFDEITSFLQNHLKEGDLLITMGAGNVVNIGESFLQH